jgi:hypothetical protein
MLQQPHSLFNLQQLLGGMCVDRGAHNCLKALHRAVLKQQGWEVGNAPTVKRKNSDAKHHTHMHNNTRTHTHTLASHRAAGPHSCTHERTSQNRQNSGAAAAADNELRRRTRQH